MMMLTTVLTLCIGLSQAITYDETLHFGTTGMPENNTGLIGWVTVTENNNGKRWVFASNGIPDHDTGEFPVPGKGNPNAILEQAFKQGVMKDPEIAIESSCLPMGPIGMAINGIPLYNPWNSDFDNAVEGSTRERFDMCQGHPDGHGRYHYHQEPSACLFKVVPGVPSSIIGVAYDGFAIYGPVDENGKTLKSADLDECHGRVRADGVYQYHTTSDFPYILGCFKGTPMIDVSKANCHKASEADENGNLPKRANVAEEEEEEDTEEEPPMYRDGEPRVPTNLWERRLPKGYMEWLSKKVFQSLKDHNWVQFAHRP